MSVSTGEIAAKRDAENALSVYNQTGQSYFQQLTAYNHMSAHLRRLLLALSVVDSRNEKYARDRSKQRRQRQPRPCWTCSCHSTSADKILQARRNIIEGLARDTKHNPIDLLRMSFESNCGCRSRDSRESTRKSDASRRQGRREREVASAKMVRRRRIDSQSSPDRTRLSSAEPCFFDDRRRGSCDNMDPGNASQEAASCESPPTRRNSPGSVDARENIYSDRRERQAEEARYAKFVYDITQEIMINGLYTDQELQAIFDKHLRINSGLLVRQDWMSCWMVCLISSILVSGKTPDIFRAIGIFVDQSRLKRPQNDHLSGYKDKMQAEIYRLRISLNLATESSGDEDDVERFVAAGKFADLSPNKPPTPPKILDRDKIVDKIRGVSEDSTVFDETRRQSRKSNAGKNTVVLVDANPELCITERDVLVTLMEMNLEPHQIETISKSLRNKSRDPVPSKTVEVDARTRDSPKREDRANSPIVWGRESRSTQFFRPSEGRDETTGPGDRRHRSA